MIPYRKRLTTGENGLPTAAAPRRVPSIGFAATCHTPIEVVIRHLKLVAEGTSMIARSNKGTARSYFEQVLNIGDRDMADELFAPESRFHYPLSELEGLESIKEYIAAFRAAFPDIHFSVEDLFGDELLKT